MELTNSLTSRYTITIGTQEKVYELGMCQNIQMKFSTITFQENFLILPIASINVILRLNWLQDEYKVEINFNELTLSFPSEVKRTCLQLDTTTNLRKISLKILVRLPKSDSLVIKLYQMEATKPVHQTSVHEKIVWKKISISFLWNPYV